MMKMLRSWPIAQQVAEFNKQDAVAKELKVKWNTMAGKNSICHYQRVKDRTK